MIIVLAILVTKASFGQQTTPSPSFTQEDYLKKSKKQKKTATILLISGAAVTLAGTAMWVGEFHDLLTDLDRVEKNKLDAAAGFVIVGGTMILASIPFYISAGKNKKMALSLALKNEPVQQIQQGTLVLKNTPSLTLKLSL